MKISKMSIALVALCVISFVLASAFTLTACGTIYHSKPGTKAQMAGTYKLTTYVQKDENGNDINRIEQLHVKAYMVVGADGYGYYAYKDDNTALWYDTTAIEYTKDDEQHELFKAIRCTVGKGTVYINKQKPGCGYEPTMGFNVDAKTFSYFIPNYTPTIRGVVPSYYTDVVYTKISDDTNLNTVANELHTSLPALPKYELKNLDGVLIFHAGQPNTSIDPTVVNTEYNKYKYYVVSFDALNEKANIYYEEIAGSAGPQTLPNVNLDIAIVQPSEENYYQHQVIIKFFGKNYVANLSAYDKTPPRYLNQTVWTEPDAEGTLWEIYNNWFEKYNNYNNKSITEIINEQRDAYNNTLE